MQKEQGQGETVQAQLLGEKSKGTRTARTARKIEQDLKRSRRMYNEYYNEISKEELINKITKAAEQIADLLQNGYTLELSKSRNGFKVYKMQKSHQVLYLHYDSERELKKLKEC